MGRFDGQVAAFLVKSGVLPYFALSVVLTWFSHSIDNINKGYTPFFILFISVELFLHRTVRRD